MAELNQVLKEDYSAKRIDYTSRDYTTILDDLIASIPTITQKWNSTDANDPGLVLVRLIAILGDMLNYQQDMESLEIYPSTVTLRKNASSIYKLIGYKMKWYRSAELYCNVINTYSNMATIPRFCTFTTANGQITYTTFNYYDLPSNMTNNGEETRIKLIQGIPVTPVRSSSSPYAQEGKAWHTIYGYNYTTDDITNNRIYLKDSNIDQDHIIMIDDTGNEWTLKENIYLTTDVGRFFQFDVDVNDRPYIELIDYWDNYNVSKFKIFYILSSGQDGQIFANTLTRLTGSVWSKVQTSASTTMYNVSGFINFTNDDSSWGYNPETPDEARKESVQYINTLDTLITLADFERATLREPGVANVRATDLTNDPGTTISYYVGDINMDGEINQDDLDLLNGYLSDPIAYPLTPYQKQLADCNQDSFVSSDDANMLEAYINGDAQGAGRYIGQQLINSVQALAPFTVKLYILRTPEYEDMDDEVYTSLILSDVSDLQQYKILPLNLQVDLHSIEKFYWTITGTFYTKEPLSLDELQTIIVNINNDLKFNYSVERVNFNTAINYKEIIETILNVDSRILMVDLDPIKYTTEENEELNKEDLIGYYTQVVPRLENPVLSEDLVYSFTLDNTPILPGSLMVRVNGGQYVLRDNNNGAIYNVDNLLQRNGKIDYTTGEVLLEFNAPIAEDLVINYTKNKVNIAVYKNLSTQNFIYDSSSLKKQDTNTSIF